MSKQVQCNRCGYIFDCEGDQEFGYCPLCENDQVEQYVSDAEIAEWRRLGGQFVDNRRKFHSPKFLKILEDGYSTIYINLSDIVKIQECLEEDKYILYSSRGEYYEVPSNKETSAIVEYLLNQLL